MSTLLHEGILNDKKVLELEIFCMEEKRYGYRRIKEYLISKGYEEELIKTYIFNKDIEIDNCRYHFLKGISKYKNYKYSNKEKEKLINYLKRAGFNDRIINEVIKAGINYENVM